MATVNYYLNTSTGDNVTGDGSSGAPWKNLQTALTDTGVEANTGNDVIINYQSGGTAVDDVDIGNAIDSTILCNSLTIKGPGADANGWDTGKVIFQGTNRDLFEIRNISANVIIEDLQIELLSTNTSNYAAFRTTSIVATYTQTIRRCRIRIDDTSATGGTKYGVWSSNSNSDITAENVIVESVGTGSATVQGFDRLSGTIATDNCNAHDCTEGYDGNITARNCLSESCTTNFDGTGTYTTCVSDAADATGVTAVTNWDDEFTNRATGDYTVKSGSADLKDNGTSIGVTDDIDGNTRVGNPDIGASENTTPQITITGPDTATADAATVYTGALLNTATSILHRIDDNSYSKSSTIDAQTATTLDADATTGWDDATTSTPAAGIPIEATSLATGATAYQLQVGIGDGVSTTYRNIQLDVPSGYQVIQTMAAVANTDADSGAFDAALIAVEDDMQAVCPTTVGADTITLNTDGTFLFSTNDTVNFDVKYWSPSTGNWSVINNTWEGQAAQTTGFFKNAISDALTSEAISDLIEI